MIINVLFTIECDKCGDEDTFENHTAVEEFQVRKMVTDEGWRVEIGRNGPEWLCPDCAENDDEDEE